ncbi:MAG TPA: putative glycolipid-binding domain-containing protein [Candidatus Limnocylindrales bacterium]|nr:putative glycolipid-binding domain-containing protein [Candidatus Limnocylindrales bacterium]
MVREVVWAQFDGLGIEHLRLLDQEGLEAHSTIVGVQDEQPFTLTYVLRCDLRWHVRSVRAECRAANRLTTLDLESDGEGRWQSGGHPVERLDGCLDVDLSATPFTNTLPIRRLELEPGASAEIAAVYIEVPALTAEPMRQRYTRLAAASGTDVYRYESPGSGFRADLRVDADGLVVDYPNLWRRIVPR